MDLDSFDTTSSADAGVKMNLSHPESGNDLRQDDGKPITITLAGQDSKRLKAADQTTADKRLARMSSGKRFTMTSEGMEGEALDRLVVATLAWDGIKVGGEAMPFTPDNARKLYQRFPWIREQAEAFVNNRSNFIPKAEAA